MKYSSIITNRGAELNTEAVATGTPLKLTKYVIGDGGGQAVEPLPGQIKLVGELFRGEIGQLMVSKEHQDQLIAVLPVPENIGGFTVREAGLLTDKGELYAICNLAAIEKPENGVGITLQFHLSASAKAAVNITTSNGVGLFLRVSEDLREIKAKGDKAQENVRINIGLGSAAVKDTQLSCDDVTAGRLLINGGALALRTVRAQRDPSPGDVTDANDLPKNSVSFAYNNILYNAPPFTGSVLDYSGLGGGYNIQLIGAYGYSGNRIAFRTHDGDKKVWNGWYEFYHTGNKPTPKELGALPLTGGQMTGAITGTYNESSSWGDQYLTKAPFFDDYTSASSSAYRPMIKQRATTSGNSWAFSMGTLLSGGALSWHLHIKGSSGLDINHKWATDGNYYSAGKLIPKDYANFDTRYYTRQAADTKFPVSIRRGARALLLTDGKLVEAPEGCVLTGGNGNEGDQIGYHYYRPLQILRNGVWMTIEDAPK